VGTVPVNVLELDGQRYLVAPRGDTQWARNLRATGRGELRWRGRAEPFRANEIPDNERPRVVEAYLARWGYQVKSYFRALPNPVDHPVFRIERLCWALEFAELLEIRRPELPIMILRVTRTAVELLGETPDEWQKLEKVVRLVGSGRVGR
jgi:hypothetical protein